MKGKIGTQENLKRMQLCPRYGFCSVPKCPLDELISHRIKLEGELSCPYTTNRKVKRIRPVPKVVKRFLKPNEDGGFKSVFEKSSPEAEK